MIDLKYSIILILAIDIMLFMGQTAISKINPDATNFYETEDTTLAGYNSGNYTIDRNASSEIPAVKTDIISLVSNFFTDTFVSGLSWIKDQIQLIGRVLSGPTHFLSIVHTPQEIVWVIGTFWWIITIFSLGYFILGRT